MYDYLITLSQLLQHSSGSSPHHHLHTGCFHFMWLICFPTSSYFFPFSALISALLLCPSSSLLLPCLPSRLSAICLPSSCFLSNLPGEPQSPCISAFLPPSLPSLPPNSLALPSGDASFQLAFFLMMILYT